MPTNYLSKLCISPLNSKRKFPGALSEAITSYHSNAVTFIAFLLEGRADDDREFSRTGGPSPYSPKYSIAHYFKKMYPLI
jgi:hypothetical protein